MAGGKETPRQKMIGMMYLVLTALLALNVSTAVLDKFLVINATLEELVHETEEKNTSILNNILKAAADTKTEKVLQAAEQAKKVREHTRVYLQKMEEYKEEMVKVSGGRDPETNVPMGVTDYDKVANMMLSTPVGKKFEKDVLDFTKELNSMAGTNLDPLAKAAKEIEFFKNNPDHQNKDFLTITFYSTPTVAGLVSVTQMQVEMLEQESKALDKLAQDADAAVVKFEDLVPMVRPRSSTVAAGAKYVADMFIAASSKAAVPEMFKNGDPIPVVDDPRTGIKMGKVEFTASASSYDATNRSKQSFKAKIVLNNNEYELDEEYTVVRPVIKVTTGVRPNLYRNCGNIVNFEVPDLGTDYNPSFSARGATFDKGSKTGQIIIIPSERECSITVSNGGLVIGTEAFGVKNIPKPSYVPKDGTNRPIDLKNGIRVAGLSAIRVTADAEANFKEEVPQDANYRIRRMDVSLVRGSNPVSQQQFNNENLEIGAWRNLARPGDLILIEIKTVTRRTYKGEDERQDVTGSEGIIRIPITN
jgi:gliding motility-associated protein GldM